MNELVDVFVLFTVIFLFLLAGQILEALSSKNEKIVSWSRVLISKRYRSELRDDTEVVASRISERVRELLKRNGIQVLRGSGVALRYFAAAVWRDVLKKSIVIQYSADMFSSEEESFVVAHEVGHFRHYHLLVLVFVHTVSIVGPLLLLKEADGLPLQVVFLLCVPVYVVVSVTLYYVLQQYVSRYLEFDADDYGIRYSSIAACVSALRKIRRYAMAAQLGSEVEAGLERRIRRAERLQVESCNVEV